MQTLFLPTRQKMLDIRDLPYYNDRKQARETSRMKRTGFAAEYYYYFYFTAREVKVISAA